MNALAAVAIASAVSVVAAGTSYVLLRRDVLDLRNRFAASVAHGQHIHADVRIAVIRSQIQRMDRPIVILGDSIVEMALLPASICGRPVLNAGIGGTTTRALADNLEYMLAGSAPYLIVVSAGANDVLGGASVKEFAEHYSHLRKSITTPAIFGTITNIDSIDVAPFNDVIRRGRHIELLSDGKTADGVHLLPSGYAVWTPRLVAEVESFCGQ